MINDNIKIHLISAGNTFLATFIGTVGVMLTSGAPIQWTLAFWGAIGVAALRAGVKAVINTFVPVRLGGRK